MGVTANLAIEYPDESGVPSRKSWIEDPIKSVDAKVVAYVKGRRRSGFFQFPAPAANTVVTQAITFSPAFEATPEVIVGLRTGASGTNTQMVWATGVTASGFTLAGKTSSASPLAASWVAEIS